MNYTFSDRIATLKPSAIREILKATSQPGVIPFAAGNPAPEAFPIEEVRNLTYQILSENPIAALQYSISEGYPVLRNRLKEYLKANHNIGREFDDLIIVSGAQQGMEMSCKIFCNEGDTIICEDPSFIGSLNAFRSYRVNLVGVPLQHDGIDVNKLEDALKANPKTKLIYLIPNFQNPSGITMSFEKRKAVLALAKKYDVMIVEDNPYGDLRFAGEAIPSIKSMDEDGHVIYCGSFSKILAPGIRVGHVTAPKEIIAKLTVAKQCEDVHTVILSQMICDGFMSHCDMAGHIAKISEIYKNKCQLMIDGLESEFSPNVQFTRPEGGLFLWCTLPEGADMINFCNIAVKEHKVAVVPGTAFTADTNASSQCFRMNYSTPTNEQIVQGIQILGKLTKELF